MERSVKRNFELEPSFCGVRWNGQVVDLHNAYNLVGFGTDLIGSEVKLSFARNEYAIDPDHLPAKATLSCTGNVKIAFNDLGAIAAPLDDEGIEIAYFDEDCDWLSFTDEEIAQQQKPLGLHVSFINGLAIRIFCDETTFATE
jgi:hypothetical protein